MTNLEAVLLAPVAIISGLAIVLGVVLLVLAVSGFDIEEDINPEVF